MWDVTYAGRDIEAWATELRECRSALTGGEPRRAAAAVRGLERLGAGPCAGIAAGWMALAEGEFAVAADHLGAARDRARRCRLPRAAAIAAVSLAQAAALAGDRATAAAVYREALAALVPHPGGVETDLRLARAAILFAAGDPVAAAAVAGAAARGAHRRGAPEAELRARLMLLGTGEPRQIVALADLSRKLDGPLAGLAVGAARRMAAGLPTREAVHGFRAIGVPGLVLQRRTPLRASGASGTAGRASAWRARTDDAGTGRAPNLVAVLSPREREVARMIGAGMSNRDVAVRLGVTVRTVEGHLYRSFAKLDISRRSELAALVNRRSELCGVG